MFKIKNKFRIILIFSMFFMLFIPITTNVVGYVSPADYFQIPEGSAAPTLDGARDTAAGTYTFIALVSDTYLDIWAYNYSSYIYMYIEVLSDSTATQFDGLTLCFEKDHDNLLEANDEATIVATGMDGSIDTTWDYEWVVGNGWVYTAADTFICDVAGSTTLQNGHNAYEFRIPYSECGWSSTDNEFGLFINAQDYNAAAGTWPDSASPDWENIDDYGEVAEVYFVSEFPIQNVLLFAIPIIFTIGIAMRKRKE